MSNRTQINFLFLLLLILITPCLKAEDDYTVLMEKAEVSFSSGSFAESEIQFRSALELKPLKADAILGLAKTLWELGNREKAIMLLNSGPEGKCDNPEFQLQAGDFFRERNLWEEAAGIYRRLLRKHPDNIKALFGLGQVYQELNNLILHFVTMINFLK